MKKNTKLVLKPLAIVLCCLILPAAIILSVSACQNSDFNAMAQIENSLGVKMPQNTTIEYKFRSAVDFHGDKLEYFVLKFETTPEDLLNNFKSRNIKIDEDITELKSAAINYFTSGFNIYKPDIPEMYLPDYDNIDDWDDNKYVFYSNEKMMLYYCHWTM